MTEKEINLLCDRVRQVAYDIHVYLGPGYLEKIYETALVHRLHKANVNVKLQYPLNVYDEDGTLLGEYYADLLVEDVVIVEIKAGRSLALEHEAQILGYLRSAKLEHGLLINFGSSKFEIRKFAWSQLMKRQSLLKWK
jgi:GxxExxY protein